MWYKNIAGRFLDQSQSTCVTDRQTDGQTDGQMDRITTLKTALAQLRHAVKIYHTVYSDEDVSALQSDLCNLVESSKEWQMLFNADKCKVMHVGYNNKQPES